MFRTVAVVIAVFYFTAIPLIAGQQGRSVNPEAIEFAAQPIDRPDLTQYRVEFFKATDPRFESPIKSVEVDAGTQRDDGILRVDLDTVLAGVPDGDYVARLRAMGAHGALDVRAPLEFFVLSREANPQGRTDHSRRDRLLTEIAWSVMAGILLIPFFVR